MAFSAGSVRIVSLALLVTYAASIPSWVADTDEFCTTMKPNPNVTAQNGTAPLTLNVADSTYRPGDNITVTVMVTSASSYRDVLIQARRLADETMVAGQFLTSLPEGVQLACGGSAVTHTTDANLTATSWKVTWSAPPTAGRGTIYFVATVIEDESTFWLNVRSSELTEVTRTSATAADVSDKGAAVTSSVSMTSAGAIPSDVIDTSTCGRTKSCMRHPSGCSGQSCDWLITWFDVGTAFKFELSAKVTQTNAWLAFGLSKDELMGFDSCVDCIHDDDSGTVKIQLSWSGRSIYNDPVDDRDAVLPATSLSSSYIDGRITCRFRRLKQPRPFNECVVPNDDGSLGNCHYPLNSSTGYFILLARGPTSKGIKYYHNKRIRSEEKVNFSYVVDDVMTVEDPSLRLNLVKAHGILMLFAWMVFASFGILMPRYCKTAWSGKKWCGKLIWFQIHQPCMIATFVLTAIGFILVFVGVKRYSNLTPPTVAHPPLGIIVMILSVINPVMGFLRPNPESSKRRIFNILHFIVGELAHIFAAITLVVAMFMVLPDLQQYVWCRAVMATYVCFHAAVEIVLAIHMHWSKIRDCCTSRSGKFELQMDSIAGGRSEHPEPATAESGSGSTFKTVVLAIHIVGVLSFAIAIAVQIGRS